MGEVASSNLVVPTIYFQPVTGGKCPKWVHGFEPGLVDLGRADSLVWSTLLDPAGCLDLELLVARTGVPVEDQARSQGESLIDAK